MEIECPSHAIAIWIEGDNLMVRFPDQQLIPIPAAEPGRLINILRVRADFAKHGKRMSVGTKAAPVAYDIEHVREAISREDDDKRKADKAAKERKALMRRVAKREAFKAADELLNMVGLA